MPPVSPVSWSLKKSCGGIPSSPVAPAGPALPAVPYPANVKERVPPTPRQATEPLVCRVGIMVPTSRGGGRPLGVHTGQGDIVLASGGIAFLFAPSPVRSPIFIVIITLPFSQGNRLSELGHLILPQHYANHEMGLKFSVYHGSRTPNPCPVAFCFQMKMFCTTEELQQSVNQGSRE